MPSPNCHACAHSYMEPDSPYLICGHKDTGRPFGLFIKKEPLEHCPSYSKFEQHPGRTAEGIPKSWVGKAQTS